jgi:2-polyprenyl-3-methyl-5-hydroxy-6-metoxy-1,4-benzoquinol methylase
MTEPTTAGQVKRPSDAFAFGENWQRYIDRHLDPARVAIAERSLKDFIGEDLTGKTFLDIGSGSGLFSLCAHRAAAVVTSIDVDPDSVAATNRLRESAGSPRDWVVLEGSILDLQLVASLSPADIVYSWGVLHHTGDMYTAIRNAASLVIPGGLFCIAIYNRVTGRYFDSERWLRIKRRYNHSPKATRHAMRMWMRFYWLAATLKKGQNPITVARNYTERGMAVATDLFDWVGGYPYEFATVEEIKKFCETECGMVTLKAVQLAPRDLGLNHFLFRREGSR